MDDRAQTARHMRQRLPRSIFKPYLRRLWFVGAVQLGGISLIASMVVFPLPIWTKIIFSLLIGYCWSASGLLAHEVLHGSVVRNTKLQNIIGFFCFLPYGIAPTFWRYWHNNLHHSHTQKLIRDPDAYPNMKVFKQSRFVQWMFPFSPGSGHKRSYLYFFFWFSLNAQIFQFYHRYRNGIFKKLEHKKVNLEIAAMFALHALCLFLVPMELWLWTTIIPFFVMNYLPFSYISTNHNLSPLTPKNDPLVNSLTVTNIKWLEPLHLNFGYHVEHHLFPTVCGNHLPKVHHALKKEFPEKYQFMPKWKAMVKLYQTARIYKDSNTLINPKTGKTFPTIGSETKATEKTKVESTQAKSTSGLEKFGQLSFASEKLNPTVSPKQEPTPS